MRRNKMLFVVFVMMQRLLAQPEILQSYIETACDRNLALQQKEFSLEQSLSALNEARGMFLPSIGIEARYSRAGGGREIAIPVGDLMNPVYRTLNQILAQSGQPALFPENIPNVSEPFLREKEHESKIRLIQPVFQPGIVYNYKIKKELKDIERASRDIYTRELVCDVKKAYYNHLKALQIVNLLNKTEALLQENLRVSQSLFDNDKTTRAAVYRAESELHAFHQQQADAEKYQELSRAYFNFLLNRPLDSSVEIMSDPENDRAVQFQIDDVEVSALEHREELVQLQKMIRIMDHQIGLSKSQFLPGITAVFDYGFQGETYDFSRENDYWMGSLVANWTLFNGLQNKSKYDQAGLQKKIASSQLEAAEMQIRLQVREAVLQLNVAEKQIESSRAGEKAASKSFEMIDRQYREGMISHIEFIDARSRLTEANVNAIVAFYDYTMQLAELEQAMASFPLNTNKE